MSFDIYGERLRRGHCEVHPAEHEEYPCSLCISESNRKNREQAEYDHHCKAQADQYYAQLFAEEEYQSWGTKP